jgi:hypothetical protein
MRNLLSFVLLSSFACDRDPPSEPHDAGSPVVVDAGPPSDCTDLRHGCACTVEEQVMCGSPGLHCCDGAWQSFFDGPCLPPPDGGVASSCDDRLAPGCPCTGAEVACPMFGWKLACEDGVFVEQTGFACCD